MAWDILTGEKVMGLDSHVCVLSRNGADAVFYDRWSSLCRAASVSFKRNTVPL
jgi:hypothetical protein